MNGLNFYDNGRCFGFFNYPYWNLIVIGVIIIGVFLLAKAYMGTGRGRGRRDSLDILKERYAAGEMSREEYLEKKDILSKR